MRPVKIPARPAQIPARPAQNSMAVTPPIQRGQPFPMQKGERPSAYAVAREAGFPQPTIVSQKLAPNVPPGSWKMGGVRMKKGGKVKASSASKRADGCATKGKTKGKII